MEVMLRINTLGYLDLLCVHNVFTVCMLQYLHEQGMHGSWIIH